MEKYFYLSNSLLLFWETDLETEEKNITPSQQVLDAIIDYSLISRFHSPILDKDIEINLN